MVNYFIYGRVTLLDEGLKLDSFAVVTVLKNIHLSFQALYLCLVVGFEFRWVCTELTAVEREKRSEGIVLLKLRVSDGCAMRKGTIHTRRRFDLLTSGAGGGASLVNAWFIGARRRSRVQAKIKMIKR